jgi:hypothetical protein
MNHLLFCVLLCWQAQCCGKNEKLEQTCLQHKWSSPQCSSHCRWWDQFSRCTSTIFFVWIMQVKETSKGKIWSKVDIQLFLCPVHRIQWRLNRAWELQPNSKLTNTKTWDGYLTTDPQTQKATWLKQRQEKTKTQRAMNFMGTTC